MTNPGYWPSPWPGEDGGPRRTQAPATGVGGLRFAPGESLAAHHRDVLSATMTVLREPGEVFLLGHSLGAVDTVSWLERIHPESLDALERSPDLPGGPFWPGGVAAHANGSLYVTYGRWCHRLGPDCSLIASCELPRDRPYNSLLILPDGHLVMKDFGGGTGARRLPEDLTGSELVVLEPDRLEIVARLELPEGSIARLSCAGSTVYVIGDQHAMAVHWEGAASALTLDDGWFVDYRRFAGQTFGWDAVIEGGAAWFLDNGEGSEQFGPSFRGRGGSSSAPLHLVRIPLPDAEPGSPEPSYIEVCGEPNGLIANPPLIDAERGIAVGYDSANSVLAAWRIDRPDQREPELLWRRTQDHAGHLIRFRDTREIVTLDFDHDRGTDQCVVLDITTGAEVARVDTGSPLQCVLFPSIGWDRDLYVATFSTITRVFVT